MNSFLSFSGNAVFSRRTGLVIMTGLWVLLFSAIFHFMMLTDVLRTAIAEKGGARETDSRDKTRIEFSQQALRLFGEVSEKSVKLPGTQLELDLTGIVAAIPEQYSKAIIAESGEPAVILGIGEVLPRSGAKVQAIHSDSVVLDNGGHLEKLLLRHLPLVFGG